MSLISTPVVVDLTVSAPTIVVDIVMTTGPAGPAGPAGTGLVISDTPPPDPTPGMAWLESDTWVQYAWYVDADGGQWVQTNGGAGGGGGGGSTSGLTIDTGEPYRMVMLSNGSVFAIPEAAVAPDTPTGVAVIIKLTSVTVNWPAAARATSYIIRRNGVQVGTTSNRTYRDLTTVMGSTYTYTVASVDQYRQQSPASTPVTAFVDPALNNAPSDVVISCWPLPIPTDGPAVIRVNATEIDVQALAYTLGVDAGSLTATQDPSVWIFRI